MISWILLGISTVIFLVLLVLTNKYSYRRGFKHGGMFSDIIANAEVIGQKKQEEEMLNNVIAQLPMGSGDESTCERH